MISPSGHSSTLSVSRYYSPFQDHRTSFSPDTSSTNSDSSASTNSSERILAVSPPEWFAAAEGSSAGGEFESSVASADYITVKDPPCNGTLNGTMVNVRVVGKGKSAEVAGPSSITVPVYNRKEVSNQSAAVSGFRPVKPGNSTINAKIIPETPQHYLRLVTVDIAKTYQTFSYESRQIPRRVLTQPGKPAKNDGADNENDDYIIRVNDVLGNGNTQYRVIDILGCGTFGQVVKCEWIQAKKIVSVKIIKNLRDYAKQSNLEVDILKWLNTKVPAKDRGHILQLFDSFHHKNHLCITYELLSYNLRDLLKQNTFRGLPINMVRAFTVRLLETLAILKDAMVMHCDLKPENILLKRAHLLPLLITSVHSPEIKLTDYGSAAHFNMPHRFTYIQTRFYRAPEIILGLPYTHAIDMWSLGCVVAELYLGAPLLPGRSEHHQLSQITDMLGAPPSYMLEKGTETNRFYNRKSSTHLSSPTTSAVKTNSSDVWHRKPSPYDTDHHKVKLADVIINYDGSSYRERAHRQMLFQTAPTKSFSEQELQERRALADFLQGLLTIDPTQRWSPLQAMGHPFVTGKPFTRPYILPSVVSYNVPSTAEKRSAPTSPANTTNDIMSTLSPPVPPLKNQANNNPFLMKQVPVEKTNSALPAVISGALQTNTNSVAQSQSPLPSQPATAAVPQAPQASPIIQPAIKRQLNAQFSSIMKKDCGRPITAVALAPHEDPAVTTATAFGHLRGRRVKIDPMVKIGTTESYRMPDEIRSTTSISTAVDFADGSQNHRDTSFYKQNNSSTAELLNSTNSLSSTATYAEEHKGGDSIPLYRTLSTDRFSNSFWSGGRSSRHAGDAAGGMLMMNK